MRLVVGALKNLYELLVDDGQMAIGILLAMLATAGWVFTLGSADPRLRDLGGPLLFLVLMALLLVNVYRAGRNAAHLSDSR